MNVHDALAALDRAEAEIKAARAALGEATTAPPPAAVFDEAKFFNVLRKSPPLGPVLTEEEVKGCQRILGACQGLPVSWVADILATEYHETAGQMRPLREYGKGQGKPYGKPGRNGGQIAYGRGDVQLTWDDNYERADRELGLNGALIANYDMALDPAISAQIMVKGMVGGWFTGKGLAAYLPEVATPQQFANARRVVNGTDRALLIAGYAVTFQTALQAGGWT